MTCQNCESMQRALDLASAEHAKLEAERARLARELRDALAAVGFHERRERHFAEALAVADGGAFRSDWDAAIEAALKDRDSLRAQLAALTAEHEGAARAAGERIGKLAGALRAVVSADVQIGKGGLSEAAVEAMICALDAARAALAEVKP